MTNETLRVLKERRSIRKFRPEQIKPEELDAFRGGHLGSHRYGRPVPSDGGGPGPGDHRLSLPDECPDHGQPGQRSLLRRPHRGGGPGGRRTAHRLQDGSLVWATCECGGLPGGGVLLDQPGYGAFRHAGGQGTAEQVGPADTLRGVGHCVLGYADGPAPAPKPRKEGYIVRP